MQVQSTVFVLGRTKIFIIHIEIISIIGKTIPAKRFESRFGKNANEMSHTDEAICDTTTHFL